MSLIFHSSVPLEFWPYAFSTAVFLINRMASSSLKMLSPFEMLFGYTPDLHHLKVFGCACYPFLKPYTKHKLEPKTTQHVFLGYPHNFKGYICYNPLTKQTIVSRHVIFHETIFPYTNSTNSSPSQSLSISDPSILLTLLNIPQHTPLNSVLIPNIQSAPIPPSTVDITCSSFMDTNATCQFLNVSSTVDTGNEINATTINLPDPPPPRNTHAMQTRAKSGIFKPKAFHITTALPTTTSYTEASKYPEWRTAMHEEFNALQAQGYHQVQGFDFDETFSPVVKKPTIRIILALAAQYNWSLTQLDVKNAFLHGILQETVYMTQPTGFQDRTCPNHVCLLHKSLYGLKHAPRAWFERFTSYLFTLGFVASTADLSLFIRSVGSSLTYLLLYVDDIIVTKPDYLYISVLKNQLALEFKISDLGPLKYFLGLEIQSSIDGIFVNQAKYLNDLLHTSGMTSAKSCITPMSTSLDLYTIAPLFNDPSLYRRLVGSLQYLTFTRSDITFSVNRVSQFMHKPTVIHFSVVKRFLRYLRGTPTLGIKFRKGSFSLQTFCDYDWAGDTSDRCSTFGFIAFIDSNQIS
ncbi:hypothetical protein IC575_024870 [Cucumis melo]